MLHRARRILGRASRVLVLSGSGISAESGVPTFRGAGGLWRSFRPEDLATAEAFARDPRLCWEWYGWRRALLAECRPNAGHLALARWALSRQGITIVTQNVDGLHELAAQACAAGSSPAAAYPIRLHGSIVHARCTRCEFRVEDARPVHPGDPLPTCPDCDGLLRPDVVWFGEMLPEAALAQARAAAHEAEACLVVGTQGAVYPAAGLVHQAKQHGAHVIIVDPGHTALEALADIKLAGLAGQVLPALLGDDLVPA